MDTDMTIAEELAKLEKKLPAGLTIRIQYARSEVVDRTIDTSAAELPLRWIGAMNGLLEGSNQGVSVRIVNNIDQMFKQSPYLKN